MKISVFKVVFLFGFSWLQWPGLLLAQTDTSYLLPQANVVATPLRENPTGSRFEQWDSTSLANTQAGNLADLLSQESAVFLKTYGLGSLATSSVRGGSAGHTAILWNGFSIQSPMLGLTDLSLLPAIFTDEISLRYGGNSALWGSGAIGGTISMVNHPDFDQKILLEAGTSIGSFGWNSQHLKAKFGTGKIGSSTRVFRQHAKNDFLFKTSGSSVEKKQSNAALEQHGVLQELFWKPRSGRELSAKVWWQDVFREIPPTTTQSRSEASQGDKILRTALHWKQTGWRNVMQARAGYFREKIDYRDDLTGLRAVSHFVSAIGEVENQWKFAPRHQLQVGLNHTFSRAFAEDFKSPPDQNQTAIFAAYRLELPRLLVQLNGRQAFVDGSLIPIVPSLGLEAKLKSWLKLKAQISRNYRLPTLNDLHWRPGGNPDLLPETGWSQEAGVLFFTKNDRHLCSYELTFFNRIIHDWILWSQREGDVFWSSNNIAEVWSRGVEQRVNWKWQANSFAVNVVLGYDFVRSTNEKAIERPRLEKGEQLIYVPENQAIGQLKLEVAGWSFSYRHRFTGSVATLTEPLPGYQVGFFGASRRFRWIGLSGSLFFQIENIWNENYRVIERRPMPGRYVRVGMKSKFLKSKN